MAVEYFKGSELPNIELTWNDSDGALRDFSTGWTFVARVGTSGAAALVQKTTGITGGNTAPNVVISWDTSELASLTPGEYVVDVIATFTATGQRLIRSFAISILPAILPMA